MRAKLEFPDSNWFRAFNLGLGETNGVLEFHMSEFDPSSSFLEMSDAHRSAFPHTGGSRAASVQVRTLDSIAPDLGLQAPLLVKIDTQGYESHVLLGGKETIGRAAAVILEVSYVELYKGQVLFDGIHALLGSMGFRFAGVIDQLCHPDTGQPLQADCVYVAARLEDKSAWAAQ